jgi:hypothetical protein
MQETLCIAYLLKIVVERKYEMAREQMGGVLI